jgi:hypothetical protein
VEIVLGCAELCVRALQRQTSERSFIKDINILKYASTWSIYRRIVPVVTVSPICALLVKEVPANMATSPHACILNSAWLRNLPIQIRNGNRSLRIWSSSMISEIFAKSLSLPTLTNVRTPIQTHKVRSIRFLAELSNRLIRRAAMFVSETF